MSYLAHFTEKETEARREDAVTPGPNPGVSPPRVMTVCSRLDTSSLKLQSGEKPALEEPQSLFFGGRKDSLRLQESQERMMCRDLTHSCIQGAWTRAFSELQLGTRDTAREQSLTSGSSESRGTTCKPTIPAPHSTNCSGVL